MKAARLVLLILIASSSLSCSLISGTAMVVTVPELRTGQVVAAKSKLILDDFAKCFPRSAISETSTKGQWWLRPYKAGQHEGHMLCVEERDKENPQSCIAPALTYPLDLNGYYDIWVGTYRPVNGGGIDIKLSSDATFTHINPCEDGIGQWPPSKDKVGRLVEVFYKRADLTGESIHLRQPHGTYESFWWGLCNAHIAYIKLVPCAPKSVKREAREREKLDRKGVIFDRDGFSAVWYYGVEDINCILQQIEDLQYGNVDALNWCIGGSLGTNFPHPMTTGRIGGGARLGDKRAERVYKDFENRRIDTLHEVVNRCHALGIKVYASHRANVHYYSNNVWNDHPEWRLKNNYGLDYANPEARAFYREFLLYIARNYDIDGLTIDFSRHRHHFNPGQIDQFEHMNTYLRELRAGLDAISAERGKRLELNASFTTGTWYDGRTAEAQGLDVQTWVDENIVDRVMPEGREVMKYIAMCKDKKTECYPRKCESMAFDGSQLQSDVHDPTAAEDSQDQPKLLTLPPLKVAEGILKWYEAGADGVFLFNHQPFVTLRNLPYPDLIRKEVASGQPFGRRVFDHVEWLDRQ